MGPRDAAPGAARGAGVAGLIQAYCLRARCGRGRRRAFNQRLRVVQTAAAGISVKRAVQKTPGTAGVPGESGY